MHAQDHAHPGDSVASSPVHSPSNGAVSIPSDRLTASGALVARSGSYSADSFIAESLSRLGSLGVQAAGVTGSIEGSEVGRGSVDSFWSLQGLSGDSEPRLRHEVGAGMMTMGFVCLAVCCRALMAVLDKLLLPAVQPAQCPCCVIWVHLLQHG